MPATCSRKATKSRAVVVNVDRKTRNIQLSIKAKDMADQSEAMANLSQQSARENAGTTSLGALLRAKLDNNEQVKSPAEGQPTTQRCCPDALSRRPFRICTPCFTDHDPLRPC